VNEVKEAIDNHELDIVSVPSFQVIIVGIRKYEVDNVVTKLDL
jgi:hypothetical protein